MRSAACALMLCTMASGAGAADYFSVLPSGSAVHDALEQSPQVVIAREQMSMASARERQLRAGVHEWAIGAKGQRRTDAAGITYTEEQYELSRGLRWPGKASLDRALGAQAVTVGELAFEDAWHEAGRTLLNGWFSWIRSLETARQMDAQVKLLQEQLRTVEARVRAGDAARVEQALAQTEVDRAAAAATAAQLEAAKGALALRRQFPALQVVEPASTDMPQGIEESDDVWKQRIVSANHELALAEAVHEDARLVAKRSSRERLPDPTVTLQFSNNLDGNDRVVGVGIVMPIGGSRRRAEHALAVGEASIAEQRARETRLKVQADAEQAILAARATHSQWQRLSQVASQSELNATAVARGYGLGEFTVAELIAARRQSQEAALAAVLARLDALEAAARLRLDAHQLWTADNHPEEQ